MEEIQLFFLKNSANKKLNDLQIRFQHLKSATSLSKERFSQYLQQLLLIIKKHEGISASKLQKFSQNHQKTAILHENIGKKHEICKENLRNLDLLKQNEGKTAEISLKNALETFKIAVNEDLWNSVKKTLEKVAGFFAEEKYFFSS